MLAPTFSFRPKPAEPPRNDSARDQAGVEEIGKQSVQPESITRFKKSTRTVDQRNRILDLLRTGPRTTFQIREVAGAMAAGTRIWELRQRGYVISAEKMALTDRDGFAHAGVARYTLLSEPAESGTVGVAE